ncbi:hypothetical protein ACNO7P_10900 [Bisgaard Taxon 45]
MNFNNFLALMFPSLFVSCKEANQDLTDKDPLDYDEVIHLDIHYLRKSQFKRTYDLEVKPKLKDILGFPPIEIEEDFDDDLYKIKAGNSIYTIVGEDTSRDEATINAGVYFFEIINKQLIEANSKYRCYSLYGDNDFAAIFLTDEMYFTAIKEIKNPYHKPYMINANPPNYGMHTN